MAPARLVGWQRRTVPCPSSYAIMQDGGHAEPVITARAQLRVAGHAFARPVGLTHPADCELICFARKLNLDAQLRQNQHDGQISQNLSSPSRKNIPLNTSGKSTA